MIRTIVLLCFIAAPALAGSWAPGLRVRFDVSGFGKKSFMSLPQNTAEAIQKHWVTVTRPASPPGLEILDLWCSPSDYTVCVFTDDTGYIAGLQIALDVDNYSDAIWDWSTQGFTQWNITTLDGEAKSYWTAQQYYISAQSLATDRQVRLARRDQSTLLQDGAIWVSGFYGQLYEISANVTVLTSPNSDFTKQACLPLMGRHYYYKMSQTTECSADKMLPWFPLVQSNQLIALGFISFGKINIPAGKTDWFEKPNRTAVKIIVPRGPECLYDLTQNTGLVTMHTYFIKNPFFVNCLIQ
ncbi:uncharacterized protein LOC142981234 [Anticarsia gemmatalis]|uniref:uncharacterized protein LOC142981234 n=1 Tax=Anticarsia gemmatalis TaxID=129554 RepID=UPI003F7710D5